MLRLFKYNRVLFIILAFFLFFKFPAFSQAQSQLPNDYYYKNQWYLNRIGFNNIWFNKFNNKGVVVAVIDSGIDIDHPDLQGRIWQNKFELEGNGLDDDHNGFIDDLNGWNFVDNNSDPRPQLGGELSDGGLNHGTVIAGIIAASTNNHIGISGISFQAKIMPLKALNEKGEGKISDVIRAIDYAVSNGADIINLSFTGSSYSQGFKEAVERAHRAGVIIVTAAGNNNQDLDINSSYPACFKGLDNNIILTVAATDALDQKADFSSFGSACIDISAPGISFFSTYFYDLENKKKKNYDGYWSGTSMSAAVVSGSLALIKEANPKLNRDELIRLLLKSSDNINLLNPNYRDKLGAGRVNLSSAVAWALEKWENLSGYFLLFPQSKIKSFKEKYSDFNTLRIVQNKGIEKRRFFTYSPDFDGNISMVTADLDGSGQVKIITGAGPGGGPHVRIFNEEGILQGQFFAYNQEFRGGVNLAVADIDADGKKEIITGAGPGGGPHVKIFDNEGNLKGQFFAYDVNFHGGVNVAAADLDGDGRSEIITAAGSGGGPHIRIFDSAGNLKGQFFAYEDDFFGGVKVKAGNIYGQDSQGKNEIVVAPGPGRSPEIRIFNSHGEKLRSFLAYDENFKNGVNLALGDLNKDGLNEIITGAGPGGSPHVRAFDGRATLLSSFYGLEDGFSGGVLVDFIELNN